MAEEMKDLDPEFVLPFLPRPLPIPRARGRVSVVGVKEGHFKNRSGTSIAGIERLAAFFQGWGTVTSVVNTRYGNSLLAAVKMPVRIRAFPCSRIEDSLLIWAGI